MARVEKNQRMEEEVSQMKGDILKAVRTEPRKKSRALSCALALLALLAMLFGLVAWVVASTGIVSVPILSSVAYRAPEVTADVVPGLSYEAFLRGGGSVGSPADIPDATLTAIVRDALATSGQTWLDEHTARVAHTGGEGVELYLPLRDNAQGSAIVAHLDVSDEDGKLVVVIRDASIGSLAVPSWMIASVLTPAIEPFVASLNESRP